MSEVKLLNLLQGIETMSEIKMSLYMSYPDGFAVFQKAAPKLPDQVTWHVGLMLWIDSEFVSQVDGVSLEKDGTVWVSFTEEYEGTIKEDNFKFLLEDGWVQTDGKPAPAEATSEEQP